jgi:hypothetical protein
VSAGVRVVVEGITDEVVAMRVLRESGHAPGPVIATRGKARLDAQLCSYNAAARGWYWLVLRDLDDDAECAPAWLDAHLPEREPMMACRLVVRAAEAWLMGDREALADYLRVAVDRVPATPEALSEPKKALLAAAARSRSRRVREDMLPHAGARVGPRYVGVLMEFAREHWRPDVAAEACPSLQRCLAALRRWP